ncbi:YifB family Mg chelatase-like AAA ATPase [Acuticoccus sp. I52.16.1]|uniref:YifB family Mg chelatase-like AAA ATPase n=1 Tax=Acuticoccus sp. I52.16.1 TaxID=2928472 RepID=UPI001FD180B4|nr:YifB family Mg chelatase-like AAA ATPase [Acuticoccus sp. I52.16.1]UOM34853.1 YifB family Mg chelatase-like AAA ATPase [Acuticoccus sp. I52.16.1]
MQGRVTTIAFRGIEAVPVTVEVQIVTGSVGFMIVGLGDKAVAESRERVRAALAACGLSLPPRRITVNLAPADLPKAGSHYDLPIALALMVALGALPQEAVEDALVLGELGLDGRIVGVAGVLPAAVSANALGLWLICPSCDGGEAAWASADMTIVAPASITAFMNHVAGRQALSRPRPQTRQIDPFVADLAEVKGQESAKRALEIAAAGGHNLLMVGPPGSGKSMLAERMPSILPPMTPATLLESAMIRSVAGDLAGGRLELNAPYRAPHHSASMAALIGGGPRGRPGEVSLCHGGVLFLDELPEFASNVLDALREPLETRRANIARANARVSYPARFQLLAAMNPCRCGHAGDLGHTCKRGKSCAQDYQARVSGPFLDRIDMTIHLDAVSPMDLRAPRGEASSAVAERVRAARERQAVRLTGEAGELNAECSGDMIEATVDADEDARTLLDRVSGEQRLSARGYHRTLKVARTIADLAASAVVRRVHMAEALAYRHAAL